MLKEHTLFGLEDKVAVAIERIRYFEPKDGSGYYVAFSGGKDSIVIKDLVIKSGVKYDIHFNFTTVDPPELLKYIREFHPDVQWNRPGESMFQLIIRKRLPPTIQRRYCCDILKENPTGQENRVLITGIRWAESKKRSQRRMFEACKKGAKRYFLHPIIDWSNSDVWKYIHDNKLHYCCLYNEGFKRIGCIGCPISSNRQKEFNRWPKFERAYRHAIFQMILRNKYGHANGTYKPKSGDDALSLTDLDTVWKWWLRKKKPPNEETQCMLFE